MIKPLILAAAASIAAPAAFAGGLYVNTEANSSFTGSDYTSTTTDLHVGYENSVGVLDWYAQGGKTIDAVDGVDSESNWSGKFGGSIAATDKLGVYGEVSFANVFDEDTDNSYGTKLGVKYSF